MIHAVDHIFMILLFVVQPIHGLREYNRYLARIEAGEPADRVQLYRQTFVLEWVAFAVLLVSWYMLSRPFAALGFNSAVGIEFWVGIVLIGIMSAYFVYAWRQSKNMTPNEKSRHKKSFGTLEHFLPRNDGDYRIFVGLSLTAGIVEETIFRGFALWYLTQFMPVWAAVVVSSIAFGLGHSYQGPGGVFRVTLVGVVFGAFYVFTGSIWLPIVAHFLLDALQGASIVEILREEDPCEQRPGEALAP